MLTCVLYHLCLQVSWYNTKKFNNSAIAQINYVADQTCVQADR